MKAKAWLGVSDELFLCYLTTKNYQEKINSYGRSHPSQEDLNNLDDCMTSYTNSERCF